MISDGGRSMAFQISKTTDMRGFGYGTLIMDLADHMIVHGIE